MGLFRGSPEARELRRTAGDSGALSAYAGYSSEGARTVSVVEAVLSSGKYCHVELSGFTVVIEKVTDAPLKDPTLSVAVPLPPVVTTL
jgi:Na+(H+)/acetate symporter ActP